MTTRDCESSGRTASWQRKDSDFGRSGFPHVNVSMALSNPMMVVPITMTVVPVVSVIFSESRHGNYEASHGHQKAQGDFFHHVSSSCWFANDQHVAYLITRSTGIKHQTSEPDLPRAVGISKHGLPCPAKRAGCTVHESLHLRFVYCAMFRALACVSFESANVAGASQ